MSEIPLEKDVWIFPIYKYGKKKYIPLLYALPLAYVIPTLLIILLSPLTYGNGLLYQIEYLLIAILYGGVGLMTRSKLRSLLNIIPAALSYLTIEFLIQGLINFNPPINNPYGSFNVAAVPLGAILSNLGYTQFEQLPAYLFLVDLLFIYIIGEIGGFYTAMISTSFWNPRGKFGILAIPGKIIAIPLTLVIVIVLPLFLHALGSGVSGGVYMAAGFTELQLAMTGGTGGQAAQNLDNIDFDKLREHSLKASNYFALSNTRLAQLKDNLMVGAAISYAISTDPNLKGFENISNALDLVGSVSEITYVLPELILGFRALQKGFEATMGAISSQSTTYDPNFKTGLTRLSYAFNNFSEAWKKADPVTGEERGLYKAITLASTLKNVEGLENYVNIAEFINALDVSITALLTLNQPFVEFLNGTYKTTIAIAHLGANDLIGADEWMGSAIEDFIQSNSSLASVPVPDAVKFSFYPSGDKLQATEIEIPVDGVIKIAKDLNNLLIRFAFGSKESILVFDAMDSVMTNMDTLNFSDTKSSSDAAYWDGLSTDLAKVQIHFDLGLANLSEAGELSNQYKNKSYGKMLDPVFVQNENSFFNQLGKQITDLVGNFTDFKFTLQAFTNTTLAFKEYSLGANAFNSWHEMYQENPGTNNITMNNSLDLSREKFLNSSNFAKAGYDVLELTQGLEPEAKSSWQGMLYTPTGNTSLYGIDLEFVSLVDTVKSTPTDTPQFQLLLEYVNALALADILGSGSV